MKQLTVIFFGFIITLICYVNLPAQWYDVSSGLPGGLRAYSIDAYDSLIATGPFTTNPNLLYITSDGGNNWYTRPLPNNLQSSPGDISIIGENKIWFCTWDGEIYSTTDGGFNWQLQFYDTTMTKFMNYIEMFDTLNGMAMGDAPANDKPALFLKTTNGGVNWISQNETSLIGLSSGDIWRRVDFVDINNGYFFSSGESPQKLYKTTNSGIDWGVINDTIFCAVIKGYEENIFLGEKIDGTIYRTLDGGQNWESDTWDFLGWALDIEFLPGDPSSVWCVSASIAFSSDTGRTWVNEYDLQSDFVYDIVFTNQDNGWLFTGAGGNFSNIYRTTNGGHGGLIVSVDDDVKDFRPEGFRLEQNYPNPFNPTTTIKYQIPELSFVTLKVFDVLGNEISTIVNEEKPAGEYEVEFNPNSHSRGSGNLSSGVYFYQLKAGSFIETKKMLLIK
jgi:photosystem II stability/assembly factor-like uncharacterized protein